LRDKYGAAPSKPFWGTIGRLPEVSARIEALPVKGTVAECASKPPASEFLELVLQLFVGHQERIFFDLVLPRLSLLAFVVGVVGLQVAGSYTKRFDSDFWF
jgi:hypothetical protein